MVLAAVPLASFAGAGRTHAPPVAAKFLPLAPDFSVLSHDIPWDAESTWSTFAAYFFFSHIPLSLGGLSVVAYILHKSDLDPITMVASASVLQTAELAGTLALLYHTADKKHKISSYFFGSSNREQRNWLKVSASGIGVLFMLIFLTSMLADRLVGPKWHQSQRSGWDQAAYAYFYGS